MSIRLSDPITFQELNSIWDFESSENFYVLKHPEKPIYIVLSKDIDDNPPINVHGLVVFKTLKDCEDFNKTHNFNCIPNSVTLERARQITLDRPPVVKAMFLWKDNQIIDIFYIR